MDKQRIARNLGAVRRRIADACERSGRDPASVSLLAVTKSVDASVTRVLAELGVADMGENRVGPALEKAEALADLDVRWHFVGHLQRNKAARVIERFPRIHSVESLKLVDVLQKEAARRDISVDVWMEVNVSGEAAKYGVAPDAASGLAKRILDCDRLRLRGLMTLAPWSDDPESARPVFRGLRELRDRLREETGAAFPGLSMGMSNDFEVAVEESATIVRVGSALFA